MLTYLFPGQGAQAKGMGEGLFERFPLLTEQADACLGYSIKTLCLEDPDQQLNLTQFTQPALFVVNALSYLQAVEEYGEKVDYFAGHSLGEYNALFAAGVFDFTTGVNLVKKRGELMSEARNGSMAAVIGLTQTDVEEHLQQYGLSSISIANINSFRQLVISGPSADILHAQDLFKSVANVSIIPLNVSGAFHSPNMGEAQPAFTQWLEKFTFKIPNRPVMANITAMPYQPTRIKATLVEQIVQPVKWLETICYLQSKPQMIFKEIGPGNVLSRLLHRIGQQQ